jgi:hypothetical protein
LCSVLLTKYHSGDKIKNNEMAGNAARMGNKRSSYTVLVGKPVGRRPLGRPRFIWEDNIKIDLREVVWGNRLDRSGAEYGQVADSCEYGDEPSDSVKCGKFLG